MAHGFGCRHRAGGVVLALFAALALVACQPATPAAERVDVVIGVGSTVEQRVLAALAAVTLEHAGLTSELTVDVGDTVALRRQARAEAIDLYWDYTGAAWVLALGQQNPPADPLESYQRVREADRDSGLVWLEPTAANATLALFVRREVLPDEPPNGMSWLAAHLSQEGETLCVDDDFRRRPGGLVELASIEYYPMNLERVEVVAASESEAIAGVASGDCFAGLATATSGQAEQAGLVPVADELGVFPAFVVAPVVRAPVLDEHPGIAEALAQVTGLLDTAALRTLNARVRAGEEPEDVARDVLAPFAPQDAAPTEG